MRLRFALESLNGACRVGALLVCLVGTAHAQTAPAAPAPAQPAALEPAAAPAAAPSIEAQLQAMQARIEAQQAEIEELRGVVAQNTENAELQAQLSQLGGEEDVSQFEGAEPISIYGYIDIGYQRIFAPKSNNVRNLVGSDKGSFLLGNVNIYFDVQPSPDWRSLTEIRFTNLPHGQETIGLSANDYERVDNMALNSTSPDGRDRVLLGSIMIERAWIQWQRYPVLNVRVGQWFTPFGIWNVDHGAPVLITVLQPDFQISQAFPSQQTGIQLLGEVPVEQLTLTYSAYISNGRTVTLFDYTDDKALGGRLALQRPGSDAFAVGASAYYGTYQEQVKSIESLMPFRVGRDTNVDLTEYVLGVDFAYDKGPFRFRTEGVMRRVDHEPGKNKEPRNSRPGTLDPDHYYWSGYTIFAYRLPWLGIEPTFQFEAIHRPSPSGDTVLATSPGFNIHFAPTVQLKNALGHVVFLDVTKGDGRSDDSYMWTLQSRLVLAF
jgi:hypothetical protein